jgi:isoleucyl-tRNA synthetase
LRRPADLYLEGSDQHRGWFQTSLLTSIGSTGDAPYKTILTHGFVNDKNGKKMSKSVGNTVDPMDIINTYGADILRLWCASVDYSDDVRISDNAIKQTSESYRRVRNTARYILGNINDFNPATDKVAYEDLTEIDKWALHRLETLKTNVTANYDKYEFYNLFNDIHYFAGLEMSAFYLDIIKDRLYVEKTDSNARRSAQTVMYEVLVAITKMISPVLSFTAEEIWGKLPEAAKDTDSVMLTSWYEAKPEWINEELGAKWDEISKLRKEVNKLLEKARQGENKIIGNALDAKLELYIADEKLKTFVNSNSDLLEMVFLVSQFDLVDEMSPEFTAAEEIEGLSLRVSHAAGEKCERCWKYSENLGTDAEYSDICPRCTDVLTAN